MDPPPVERFRYVDYFLRFLGYPEGEVEILASVIFAPEVSCLFEQRSAESREMAYIIIGSIYYAYKVILMIIYLIDNEEGISDIALVFFIVILASIVPRVFGFYNIEKLLI